MNGRPIIGAVLITLLTVGQPVLAATEISGNIDTDTIWTKENGPYQVTTTINVGTDEAPATLDIGQGTVVEFLDGAQMNIFGDLIVTGTEAEPVIFTPSPGSSSNDWQVLIFNSTQTSINHLATDNEGYSLLIFDSQASLSGLDLNGGDLLLDNSNVTATSLDFDQGALLAFDTQLNIFNSSINGTNSGFGLIADGGSINATGLSVSDVDSGINISGGNLAQLSGVVVTNTNGPALNISQSTVSVVGSTFAHGNNIGIGISDGSVVDMYGSSVSGYMAPGMAIDGSSFNGSDIDIANNLIGVATNGSQVVIEKASIKDHQIFGVDHSGEGFVKISQSSLGNNGMAGVMGNGTEAVDARGNYWGHPEGPTLDPMNPEAVILGDGVMGNVAYEPWLSEYCETDCHSNIMFLPGIMSSRLYEYGELLWEGSDTDVERLLLDENGQSISSEIVATEVIDTFDAIVNLDIYKSLLNDLESRKNSGSINDFKAIAYDWRLSLPQILESGVENAGSISYLATTTNPYIKENLRELASTSKSGKVTIITHSNGGLLAKALINQLGDEAPNLIDKLILVAVPQLGTPKAIGSLLHGYDSGIPFKISDETAREFAKNAPMSYQLLPFEDYYNAEGHTISVPYITFEDGEATQPFIDAYGYAITTEELYDFLTGSDGRLQPAYEDVKSPSVANAAMLDSALATQDTLDSSWQPPQGIEVHQIAGVGEHTLSGITYMTVRKPLNLLNPSHGFEAQLSYKPKLTVDGDGTVVAPSALAMSDNEAQRWWVDLQNYNDTILKSLPGFSALATKHADILEIDELRAFIFDYLLTNTASSIPQYVTDEIPTIEDSDRLMFTLHSPLAMSAVDEEGRIVSEYESHLPGADFIRHGDVQTLIIPIDTRFTLVLNGEGNGSFTLEMEEIHDTEIVASSTFSGIPTSSSTIATVSFNEGQIESAGQLLVDTDGDSLVDLVYTPKLGEETYTPDTSSEVIEISKTLSSGYYKPRPQVLGVTSELTLEQILEIVENLQVAIQTLENMKNQISPEMYKQISQQLVQLTHTVGRLLIEYQL